jgi:hypothetical protein
MASNDCRIARKLLVEPHQSRRNVNERIEPVDTLRQDDQQVDVSVPGARLVRRIHKG